MTDAAQAEAAGQPGALVVIISGPSGVGKDSIIAAMKERGQRAPAWPRRYVITCTTRARRSTEVADVSYHFLAGEAFDRLREADALLEASQVHGYWYGTPRDQVREALASGRDAILKIDVQGAHKVQARIPDALLIFVVPPSLEELRARLVSRNTESQEDLERRFRNASIELARQGDYDHVVVNETGKVEETAERIDAIIAAEHERFPDRRICA
jgi:guanylate kinase